ncbi:hypothetical protein [Streptomyces sp. NBC_00503]|uniref:hypothetical protein n=1 Tax=Streptomyces sp. NBC_00503 TaxID=2903659 RepID=UPI002E80AE95|nr:hypothetical protein [Streptomyces sp. NBC_00503]WUD86382.1 hypothetical protein OG490_37860 [Streptomyces sp. NBC_00503]
MAPDRIHPRRAARDQVTALVPHDGLGALASWARAAPIRLAGYEDDLAEPHILPSVD